MSKYLPSQRYSRTSTVVQQGIFNWHKGKNFPQKFSIYENCLNNKDNNELNYNVCKVCKIYQAVGKFNKHNSTDLN